MAEPAYTADLLALAEELRRIAGLPPGRAMMALGQLMDSGDADGVTARLREVRRGAARLAVEQAGSQAALARELGVSVMLVSRAVRDELRHDR